MPSLTKKIAAGTIIQILSKAINGLLSVFTIALIARYLKPDGFGQFTIIIAFLSFFGILVDMGIYLTALQMIAEPGRDSKKIFSNAFTMRVAIAGFFLVLAPSISLLFPYPAIVKKGMFAASFAFFFISLCQILHAIFQKELKMLASEISEVIGKTVILIAVAIAVYLKLNLVAIMLCLSLGNLVHFLTKFFFSQKYIKTKFAFNKEVWLEIISKSWPIALSITFNLIYLRGDTIILSLFANEAQVGFYGASYKIIDVLTTLPIILAGLMLPLFTAAWAEKNIPKLKRYLQISFDASAMIALPIIFGVQFIAAPTMVFVAGEEFYPSGKILRILIIAVSMIFFGTMFSHFIVAINKQRIILWGFLTTAVLSLAGYFILIPKFSTFGAAWVTVFSETLMAVIGFFVIYRTAKISLNFKIFFKSLFSALIMSLFLYVIRDSNLFIIISAGALIYTLSMLLAGGIDREMITSIIQK